jgi:taurine--2-oxoglutarate transaminase
MSDSDQIREMEKKYVYGTWRYEHAWNPMVVDSAEGVHFTDLDGKRVLDFSSQLMCSNLGHSADEVKQAMAEQAKKLCYAAPGFATVPAALLGKKLAEITPGSLDKSFLTIGGAEANEAAIKIARLYTRKTKLISRYRSYHGASSGAIALTGDPRTQYAVGMPGVVRAPDCYCYRCPFGKEYPGCEITCAEIIDEIIRMEGPKTVAGVALEPIVGSNGILVPPDEYMPRVREICDEHDALLIDDEVMAGFGRTGKMFCVEHWDVVPDIMTMAKGITGAYIPMGAAVTTRKIADYFDRPENLFVHGQTYAMHPLTCAAALAAIEQYSKYKLVENAAKMGEVLGKRLTELKEDHKSVGEVRGKGLFWAVELVKDRDTKEPFVTREQKFEPNMLKRVSAACMEQGVYVVNIINILLVAPPLIVGEDDIDKGVAALDEALKLADREAK